MTIKKIIEELTPKRVEEKIEEVQKIKLPSELQKWVKEYEKVGERNPFFWKFIYKLNLETSPFKIPTEYADSIVKNKFLITMLIILIDDVADRKKQDIMMDKFSRIPLNENRIISLNKLTKREKKYLNFTIKIWKKINKGIKGYPLYEKFKKIFNYDIQQILNAMRYSYIINEYPSFINKTEYWLYSPHTLQGIINSDLDLMCLPALDETKLTKIREIFWEAQKIARIANCLATWEREIREGDFSSGVVAYALNFNLLSTKDLNKKNKDKIIFKINHSNVEDKLLAEFKNCYNKIYNLCKDVESIKSEIFLYQLRELFFIYLISKNTNIYK